VTSDESVSTEKHHGPLRILVESIVLVVVAIVLALIVKTFLVQAFYIPSVSMEPGLRVNDRILVEKPSYWMDGKPERGDVVVFEDPGGWLEADADAPPPSGFTHLLSRIGLYPTGGHLVKRVIGVGGDRIVCCDKQGRLKVNGHPLDEADYIAQNLPCAGPMDQDEGGHRGGCRGWSVKVPEGRLFVMGDNRAQSADSSFHLCSPKARKARKAARRCGNAFVPQELVVGKVVALVWPLSHFRTLHRPETYDAVPASRR